MSDDERTVRHRDDGPTGYRGRGVVTRPGETVTRDAATAEELVETGHFEYVDESPSDEVGDGDEADVEDDLREFDAEVDRTEEVENDESDLESDNDEDEPEDLTEVAPFDPGEKTIAELGEGLDDASEDELRALHQLELAGKDRSGALDIIETRRDGE